MDKPDELKRAKILKDITDTHKEIVRLIYIKYSNPENLRKKYTELIKAKEMRLRSLAKKLEKNCDE